MGWRHRAGLARQHGYTFATAGAEVEPGLDRIAREAAARVQSVTAHQAQLAPMQVLLLL